MVKKTTYKYLSLNNKGYNCFKKHNTTKINKYQRLISLLGALIGIFLLPKIAYLSSITPEKIIELTNQERIEAGVSALTVNRLLTQAAQKKSQAILSAQTFKHNIDGKKFSSWIQDEGYEYSYVGENLAIDFVTSEGVVRAWINSETHRKNLLNSRFSEIGIAVASGKFAGEDTIVVAQMFGTPAPGIVTGQTSNINSKNTFSITDLTLNSSPQAGLRQRIYSGPYNAAKQTDGRKPLAARLTNNINNIITLNYTTQETLNSTPQFIAMNKNFEQPDFLPLTFNIIIAIISALIILSMLYIGAFRLSFFTKAMHHAHAKK